MTQASIIFTGGPIFDGTDLHEAKAVRFENEIFIGLVTRQDITPNDEVIDLDGDILSPGYVDLQVNGGDGLMFNDDPSVATLKRMGRAHRSLGAVKILPTLITDSPKQTCAAIDAVRKAVADGVPGIAGLHLEGPHLSITRKGAHDAKFIRRMNEADLKALLSAKTDLPVLKVTVAPENVTTDQVAQLAGGGILVSLGHTDADYETCMAYAHAGARCTTHLFNAMSQLGSRAPGLVGATLDCHALSAGMIADGIHVHPAAMRTAWAVKTGPGVLFLVSDAMAVAGTELDEFNLDGRTIRRRNGQLRLLDGTLAGADLDLTKAISVMVNEVVVPLEAALAAATSGPANLCGIDHGLQKGVTPLHELIRISSDLTGAAPIIPEAP